VFFTSPSQLASIVGTAAWYTTIISTAAALVGFTFVYLLLKRYEGKNIVEIFEINYGRIISLPVSGIIALYFLFSVALGIREFTDVLKIYALPLTSMPAIILIFVAAVTVLCIVGLESIARLSKLFAYVLLAGLLIVLILSVQNYEFYRLFPIGGYGIGNTVLHGLTRSSFYGEVLILAVIAGSLQGINHIRKAGYTSLAISGLLTATCLLAFTLAFPYFVASETTSAMYELAAIIDYGRFLQRLDPIFFLVWNISSFIFITVSFYTFISIYCKIFRFGDTKPAILPAAVILISIALIPEDIGEIAMGYVQSSREWGWTIIYLIPFITLIISRLRKGGVEGRNA
jgi:spore germination protein KB